MARRIIQKDLDLNKDSFPDVRIKAIKVRQSPTVATRNPRTGYFTGRYVSKRGDSTRALMKVSARKLKGAKKIKRPSQKKKLKTILNPKMQRLIVGRTKKVRRHKRSGVRIRKYKRR